MYDLLMLTLRSTMFWRHQQVQGYFYPRPWPCQLERVLVAAEADTSLRALDPRVVFVGGGDTFLRLPFLQLGDVAVAVFCVLSVTLWPTTLK